MARLNLNGTVRLERPPKEAASEPCATCPFRKGNDRELARLVPEMVHPDSPLAWVNQFLKPIARILVRIAPRFVAWNTRVLAKRLAARVPFVCHSSIYKFDHGRLDDLCDESEWRLCAGADAQWKGQ